MPLRYGERPGEKTSKRLFSAPEGLGGKINEGKEHGAKKKTGQRRPVGDLLAGGPRSRGRNRNKNPQKKCAHRPSSLGKEAVEQDPGGYKWRTQTHHRESANGVGKHVSTKEVWVGKRSRKKRGAVIDVLKALGARRANSTVYGEAGD